MKSAPISSSAGLAQAIATCTTALAAYVEAPDSLELWQDLRAKRIAVGEVATQLSRQLTDAASLQPLLDLQLKLAAAGALDHQIPADDFARAATLCAQGTAGLLSAMMLTPAYQWADAPAYDSVPEMLWSAYTAWLFHSPKSFSVVGQAESFAAHYLRRLGEFDALVTRHPNAKGVRQALGLFAASGNCIPLYFTTGSLRRHMELRGRLLSAAVAVDRRNDFPARARAGRRLRVGFVNRHFGSQTETYTTLPTFEQMDPEKYEVQLFTCHYQDSSLEQYASGRAAKLTVLPQSLAEQLQVLRAAELDVAVFGTNVTAVCHEVTRLALHRVAPLQVVNNSSCTTTGLPEIDLYVSGTATEIAGAAEHFTERLGLVQGPAHAFNYEADKQEPVSTPTRASLGLPEDAVVFVSAANFFKVTPEMQHVWARLLAAVPGSRLLVHPFNPNWASQYPITRFRSEFHGVLRQHGVAPDRLVISTARFPSRSDVRALLSVGDLYLDTFPFAGVNSLIDPLESGVAVITQEGETFRSRMGAALLRTLGLEQLIAADADAYQALAVRLATDAPARAALREQITTAMARLPLFLDTLAASDAFGALLDRAYDELLQCGPAGFRAERRPIIGPEVASTPVRQARGRELLANGRSASAVDYFLSAIQSDERNASLWCDVADALRSSNRTTEAVSALQTCLQIDNHYVPGWKLLAELARSLGHAELEAEAEAMLRTIASGSGQPVRTRVLIYTDDPDAGGVAQYNHSLMVGLTVAGCEVSCAQTQSKSPLVAAQRQLGVTHHWIPYDTKQEFARTIDDLAPAHPIFKAAKPDLIVFSDCCPISNMAARDVAVQMGIPYVVVVGFVGSYLADRFKSVLSRLAAQYASARAVVAVSQENLELLRNRFGLAASAGQVIHYGRPEKFFEPRDEEVRTRLRTELNLSDDAVVCFTAARLTGIKGFLYQILAAKHLLAQKGHENLHFVWAGEGEQRAALEDAIVSSGLTGHVHLLGHRWDVADWYDAADIFVLPSDLEGMPLAIMEAMAKGLPVVATAVSGIPEELGNTGQLLTPAAKNRQALVSQLIHTLHLWASNAALRQSVGEAGRLRAQAMFREPLMIERMVALISAHLVPAAAHTVSA